MVSLFWIVVVIRLPMHTPNPVKRISPMIILVEYIDIISFASVVHSIVLAFLIVFVPIVREHVIHEGF
jgi:hypothetical protein